MTKAKPKVVEIKSWLSGKVLFSCEAESLRDAVAKAIAERADLRYADLRSADLRYANLSYANLPSPTAVLLAHWPDLSPQLVADLMLFDSTCHPDPTAFDRWAAGGDCPYSGVHVQRAVNFCEDKSLWGKGVPCRPYDLMIRILKEVCPEWTDKQRAEFEKRFEEARKVSDPFFRRRRDASNCPTRNRVIRDDGISGGDGWRQDSP